jgi:hypothetical protein
MAAQTPRAGHQDAAREVMLHMSSLSHARQMVHEVCETDGMWGSWNVVAKSDIPLGFQAQLVGRELIRTAVSFAERWKYSIEKVSAERRYQLTKAYSPSLLQLLYIDGLSAGTWPAFEREYLNLDNPQSEEELLFVQRWGDLLGSARKEVVRYFEGTKSSFHKACAEYQAVSHSVARSIAISVR